MTSRLPSAVGPAPLKLLLLAAAVGVGGGAMAVAFRALSVALPPLLWPRSANLVLAVAESGRVWRFIVPIAGALLAGLVLQLGVRWRGAARGWDILEAVVLRDGILHFRSAVVKAASSLVTCVAAGPVGREGPMVLLSAATASAGARRLGLPARQRRILVGCGVAAGIACAYNAPFGAALFTMEIIVGNFALEVFAPLVFSSAVATLLSRAAFTSDPVFRLPHFRLVSGWEVLGYVALGALAGLTAALFLRTLRAAARIYRKARLPRPVAMASAGLALAVAIQFVPDIVGNGREGILLLFHSEWTVAFALLLLVLRLALTSATVGSGAVGGVFTPTLFLGALLGDAFGSGLHLIAPTLTAGPKAYAVIGMGCMLAGTTHAPITAALLLFEMTLDYNIILPLMLGASAASLVARMVDVESVYTEALRRKRGTSTPGEAAVMRKLTVSDVMRAEHRTVPAATPLPQLLDMFISARRNHLYIVDERGEFSGAASLYEAGRALREAEDPGRITAGDIADPEFPATYPDEHLDRTLERFWTAECERLPVLESALSRRIVATVSKRDILGVYSVEVLHRRTMLARFDVEGETAAHPTYVELPEDHAVDAVEVLPELMGRTFSESRLRERFGLSVLVVRRIDADGKVQRIIPEGKTTLVEGDVLVVFGERAKIDAYRAG